MLENNRNKTLSHDNCFPSEYIRNMSSYAANPTGMGSATGAHFHRVEVQMRNYVNPSPAPAYYAPDPRMMSPGVAMGGSPVGEFTHRFVRNLFRPKAI
jgi:hypothetical protein